MHTLSNKEYTGFRQLSLFNTIMLSRSSKFAKNLDNIQSKYNYVDKILTLNKSLHQIQQSVHFYSDSLKNTTPFSQLSIAKKIRYIAIKIFHFFNCTDYKIRILTKSLPILIPMVEEKIQNFDEIEKEMSSLNNTKIQYSLKLKQIVLLHKEFRKANPNIVSWDETAHEVNDFILNKFQQLKRGNDVAIQPEFYHSTKEEFFDLILSQKNIKESDTGVKGRGVYLSTNIEYQKYGPYAFALDSRAVNSPSTCYPAVYTAEHGGMGKYMSVWICHKKNVTLNSNIVALITVASMNDRNAVITQINKHGLNVPVVTRKACCVISDLFEKVIASANPAVPNFPANWKVEESVKGPRLLTAFRAA